MIRFAILVLTLFLFLFSFAAWGYGVGYSSFPLMQDRKLISAEATGIISNGSGLGMQVRYTHKLNKHTIVDAGVGVSGGDRSGRLFLGADYEIFPDYNQQPRFSVKASVENALEFEARHNIISVAPTLSKGFNFWGHEGFPFVSIPMGVSLRGEDSTYHTVVNLAMGITGHLPIKGYSHLTANAEATISLRNNYSAIFFGVSYPLE
ncbi:MAG: hypothetical protein HN353_00645 [Bdellovibrionales bacterium]|jgi:hypothetical protein|nr:hypothetical protein [Bdellovibrionales bacterium]MBT3524666.1 hypothetical protein [Bdellovibrionales bacterium]